MKNQKDKIFVAGHNGMVGSAIVRYLTLAGFNNIITVNREKLDLTNQIAVQNFFAREKFDQVYLAAAKVGGIYANNSYPAQFIYENLMIQNNVIHQAYLSGVKRLLFLGSSCIYPKLAPQPMAEDLLLTGKLEPTNEPYAIAKIAGIKMCESYNRQYGENFGVDYRSIMPTNLYGTGDNYHPENSHVIPALIRRFHEAKITNQPKILIWGTGMPRREFLHVDDMASASVFLMGLDQSIYRRQTQIMESHINAGSGFDISISELASLLSDIIGYKGRIEFDSSKPDGSPKKLMNSNKLNNLGWKPKINLKEGLERTYEEYLKSLNAFVKFTN